MNMPYDLPIDPALDLVLERTVDVPRALVWKAWTTPELLSQWFTPAPWKTPECEIDLRPGGIFRTVMRGPNGEEADNSGCYLEVVENERLVWTSALGPGYRPHPALADVSAVDFHFTAIITLEDAGPGTKYTARVLHADPEARDRHDAMGFQAGWGAAFDQLVALMKNEG
jgi:uncharacterized protein YndB with AHSA1/START domain